MPIRKPMIQVAGVQQEMPATDWIELKEKTLSLQSPTAAENISFINKTSKQITITGIEVVMRGSSPSVTWNLFYATSRTSGTPTQVFASNRTSTVTESINSFANSIIPAGSYVWVITSAVSGTINEFALTVDHT
jgi:hypothetical protein